MQPTTKRGSVASHHILPRDPALLNLGDPALGDTHPVSDLLLSQAPDLAYLSETMPDDSGQQLPLAGLDRLLTTGPLDICTPDVAPTRMAHHRFPSCSARSLR